MEIKHNKIFDEFHSYADSAILEDIRMFLEAEEAVDEYHVETDEGNKIFVNMVLEKFSYLVARNIFLKLAEFMRRSYYNVYTCEEKGEQVCYRYLTGMHGKDGIKMEIVIG